MALQREDILRLSELARLELSEEEIQHMTEDLDRILQYVDRLRMIPTDGVEPASMPERTTWRDDVAMPCDDVVREYILSNFPGRRADLLMTPGVFLRPKS